MTRLSPLCLSLTPTTIHDDGRDEACFTPFAFPLAALFPSNLYSSSEHSSRASILLQLHFVVEHRVTVAVMVKHSSSFFVMYRLVAFLSVGKEERIHRYGESTEPRMPPQAVGWRVKNGTLYPHRRSRAHPLVSFQAERQKHTQTLLVSLGYSGRNHLAKEAEWSWSLLKLSHTSQGPEEQHEARSSFFLPNPSTLKRTVGLPAVDRSLKEMITLV